MIPDPETSYPRDFLGYGAQRALDAGVPVDRIVNTWSVDRLLARTGQRG